MTPLGEHILAAFKTREGQAYLEEIIVERFKKLTHDEQQQVMALFATEGDDTVIKEIHADTLAALQKTHPIEAVFIVQKIARGKITVLPIPTPKGA